MVFVQSLHGLSHTKLEDTKAEHLELSVQALDRLATKTLAGAVLTEPERVSQKPLRFARTVCISKPLPPQPPAVAAPLPSKRHPAAALSAAFARRD